MKKVLMMIPGPTPVDKRILEALSRETISHLDPELVKILKETLHHLKVLVGCSTGEAFTLPGTGTLGMEIALLNSLKKGDKLLVVSHGFFGDRFAEIAQVFDIEVEVLTCPWGEIVGIDKIAGKLKEKKFDAITVTHIDTSTGVCAPLKEIGNILKEHPDTQYIVDGVCATGGVEERMDDWGIDILFTGNQKAIGVPPGLTNVVFNEKALVRRNSLGKIVSYYSDINRWLPIMKEPGAGYFSTHAINMVFALHKGLQIIMDEGLEKRYQKHKNYSMVFEKGLKALGFDLLVAEEIRANTVSTVLYPSGIEDVSFRKKLYDNGVLVSAGKGMLSGKIFRLGHMGNITESEILNTLSMIEKTLFDMDYQFEWGSSLGASLKAMFEK